MFAHGTTGSLIGATPATQTIAVYSDALGAIASLGCHQQVYRLNRANLYPQTPVLWREDLLHQCS
ncbi:MAG: hypothetical protein AB1589_02770 [Cyanobacteriota bacterium]